jgi:GNS1/SUR4 family
MQITQFLVGGSGAMIHSFISYNIPVGAASRTNAAASSASAVANSGSAHGGANVKGAFDQETVPCITSSGTTFAIWLNVFYLAPLTYLFVAFFIESYLRRSNAASSKSKGSKGTDVATIGEKAAWEAANDVKREVYGESKESVKKANGRVLRSRQ